MWKLWGDCDEQFIEDDGPFIKIEGDPDYASTCPECDAYIYDGEEDHAEDCNNRDWRPSGPGSWCNGAGIRVHDSNDAVTVSISVGDLRGAFAFTVRRLSDGRLVMHLPYPGEDLPHMRTQKISEGTLEIIRG